MLTGSAVDNAMTASDERSHDVWDQFLGAAGASLSRHVLDTWLRPVHCRSVLDGVVTLEVRDQFSRDWLNDHYFDFIRDGLTHQLGHSIAIEWVINPSLPPQLAPLGDDEDSRADSPGQESAVTNGGTTTPGAGLAPDAYPTLNRRYSFETFICGPSNQFAVAASRAVADKPGTAYNPLFLFGRVGLGKTHLLCAIGHQVLKNSPAHRVIYTTSEQFTNEVVNAVLGNKLEQLHTKYRDNCEVLLIDDIQLIAGKERTQHEFFHIFNTLYDSQRQIVVTSDKLPHEIPDIEERLRNRFQFGLIADIQAPEIETRVAILRRKALDEQVELSDDVTFFLAEAIRSNVRELEGALVRILAHASLTGSPITIDYARQVLADILHTRAQQVSIESIQRTVADFYSVRVADLKSRRRQKTLVRPRQVAMYLARKHAGASYPDLGVRFGNKDHTTVLSACRKIEKLLKTDSELRGQVNELERKLDVLSK